MKLRTTGIALLVLMLAAIAMVPYVSAAKNLASDDQSSDDMNDVARLQQSHHIPPEYFKDAKPADPLPESAMITIILSEKTLKNTSRDSTAGTIFLPLSRINSGTEFIESNDHQNRLLEKEMNPDESVVLVRMPRDMFERFRATTEGDFLVLPVSNFARYYRNLTDLDSHLVPDGNSLTVIPDGENAGIPVKPAVVPTVIQTLALPGSGVNVDNNPGLLSPPGPDTWHNEWLNFVRSDTSKGYNYCIGQITPNTWWVSGHNDDYYSPQEREYYLNYGQDAIEIVVNYDHYNFPTGKISLFPAIYDNYSPDPIPLEDWEDSGVGIFELNPATFPDAYGYHVELYNGKYYITFQDMGNLTWYDHYTYNDQDNPSTTFTQASGSVEFRQISDPITDTFYAYTTPVMDEWARESSGTWKKPSSVWTYNGWTGNENFVHISYSWGGSGNQNLITNSYLWSGWA